MLVYILKEGVTTVGRRQEGSDLDIHLNGALVAENHCTITNTDGTVHLNVMKDASTYLNGNLVSEALELHHGDRLVIGGNHFFRFNHPVQVNISGETSVSLYD